MSQLRLLSHDARGKPKGLFEGPCAIYLNVWGGAPENYRSIEDTQKQMWFSRTQRLFSRLW